MSATLRGCFGAARPARMKKRRPLSLAAGRGNSAAAPLKMCGGMPLRPHTRRGSGARRRRRGRRPAAP
ncbi:g1501 [Coccomyxa elongata]